MPFIQRKPTCACGGGCPRCKEHAGSTELEISQPGDRHEQEADRIAERVTQVPDPQRLEKPLILQRRAAHHAESAMVPPIVHEVLRSPGQPLDPATRGFMEPRFGHDFSQVRVHTDAKATESARALDALAYTVGQNIVFGAIRTWNDRGAAPTGPRAYPRGAAAWVKPKSAAGRSSGSAW